MGLRTWGPVNFTIKQRKFEADNGLTVLAYDITENSKVSSCKVKVIDLNGKELKAGTDYEKPLTYTDGEGNPIEPDNKPAAGTKPI